VSWFDFLNGFRILDEWSPFFVFWTFLIFHKKVLKNFSFFNTIDIFCNELYLIFSEEIYEFISKIKSEVLRNFRKIHVLLYFWFYMFYLHRDFFLNIRESGYKFIIIYDFILWVLQIRKYFLIKSIITVCSSFQIFLILCLLFFKILFLNKLLHIYKIIGFFQFFCWILLFF